MNRKNWIYSSADFGARGSEFGIGLSGLTNVGTQTDTSVSNETVVDPLFADSASQAQAESDAAIAAAQAAQQQADDLAAQVATLTQQLNDAQATGTQASASVAYSLQTQISQMQSQIDSQRQLAATNAAAAAAAKQKVASITGSLAPYSKYAPYAAAAVVLFVVGLVVFKKR